MAQFAQYSYLTQNNKTTTLLSSLQNGGTNLSYTYDELGNITHIYQNAQLQSQYYYDDLSQLVRENSVSQDKTITYIYDNGGNLLSRKEYAYTTADDLTGLSYTETGSYGYDTTWKDKMVSYNGQTITYDEIGNPLLYRGMTLGWKDGRKLAGVSMTGNSGWFIYNHEGIRTIKYFDTGSSEYFLNGSNIVREIRSDATGNHVLDFFYDDQGNLFGFQYDNNKYYYVRNGQNDITGILDSSGGIVVSYEYDTWGKLLGVSGNTTLGNLNPFRYRGYYYDSETGLYYLNSRYYDPETGRFINADGQLNVDDGVLGCNMFAYCMNNPVNYYDSDGMKPNENTPPPESSGYQAPKGGPKKGKTKSGKVGWVDKNGNIWVPDPSNHGIGADGDSDHWDVNRKDGKGYTNVGRSGKSWGGKGKAPNIPKAYVPSSINWKGIGIGALIVIFVIVVVALAPYTGGGSLILLGV